MKRKKWTELTVLEFCRKHRACDGGCFWGLSTGAKTMGELWRREDMPPNYRTWIATRPGVLDHIVLVRFACFCARQVWDQLTDERSRKAVETAEAFCQGEATREECMIAADAAAHAAYAADRAASYAAYAAAHAAYAAAHTAANAAANTAAYYAAYAAAKAADADTRGEQAVWLIKNVEV